MYHITDDQVDFILSDIRARGVEMESLQQDLLDHVCCVIENTLEENGDFGRCYASVIPSFFRNELKEIEEETLSLLTFKHYYTMKKMMLMSGIASALFLSSGIFFKFMFWPSASIQMVLGIGILSFLFLPLMFLLKIRENRKTSDKVLAAIGAIAAIMICLSILFKVQHWPGANLMGMSSIGLLVLVYMPVNLAFGIRNPDTRVNTIVSSVLLVAGCGLLLALVRTPAAGRIDNLSVLGHLVRNEQILKNERVALQEADADGMPDEKIFATGEQINTLCEDLKTRIIKEETGYTSIPADYASRNIVIRDGSVRGHFIPESDASNKLVTLRKAVEDFNKITAADPAIQPIHVTWSVLDQNEFSIVGALTCFVEIQVLVLQNQKMLLRRQKVG